MNASPTPITRPGLSSGPDASAGASPRPWWRHAMVWVVIGGPLAVVVASLATAVIAARGADPVVGSDPGETASTRPAIQARNHAATATAGPAR